jgi:hypothetical protein
VVSASLPFFFFFIPRLVFCASILAPGQTPSRHGGDPWHIKREEQRMNKGSRAAAAAAAQEQNSVSAVAAASAAAKSACYVCVRVCPCLPVSVPVLAIGAMSEVGSPCDHSVLQYRLCSHFCSLLSRFWVSCVLSHQSTTRVFTFYFCVFLSFFFAVKRVFFYCYFFFH